MQLENSFTVPAGVDEAWAVLLDVERVAPCMPGATLIGHEGDSFEGTVKVKVGPIAVSYRGTAEFAERDDAAHTVKINAKGRETRGSGTANATISCKLTTEGSGTKVDVVTDLSITGKPAQFGRGVIGEVAGKVITQFADALAEEISSGQKAPAQEAPATDTATETAAEPAGATAAQSRPEAATAPAAPQAATTTVTPEPPKPAPASPPAAPTRRSAEAIDLLDVAGAPVAKRVAPIAALVAVLLLVLALRRRRG